MRTWLHLLRSAPSEGLPTAMLPSRFFRWVECPHPARSRTLAPDPSPADALAAAISDADRRSAETTASAVRAMGSASGAESARLAASLDSATASLRDALTLLSLTGGLPLHEPAARHGLQSTGRALDAAALVLEDTAARARHDARLRTADADLEIARRRLLHTLEQQEADITARLRDIERFSLVVRRARLEVASLPPTSDLPTEPRVLITGLDVPGRVTSLRSAIASSHRTVPNLRTLHRDDALPMSLDVHARAIAATAETARVIDALLDLRSAVAARWPELL